MFHLKTKKQKILFFSVVFLLIAGSFGFGKASKAQNLDSLSTGTGTAQDINSYGQASDSKTFDPFDQYDTTSSNADSNKKLDQYDTTSSNADSNKKLDQFDTTSSVRKDYHGIGTETTGPGGSCQNVDLFSPTTWVNCFLIHIMQLFALFLNVAATLFSMVINTQVFDDVLKNNAAVYTAWATVRDFLNVFFIMILLFSAFCTVFQIDRYSYKKILLRLVLMALLVNFSYPITRFIIDVSNSMMYYLIGNLGIISPKGTIWATYAQNGALGQILGQTNAATSVSTAYLFACVIFVFIFSVTLLIVAGMLLIRIVALAILLIFSSVAFTGSIVPGLTGQASKWWDKIFQYAFFGPVMIFMIYVANEMMRSLGGMTGGPNASAQGSALNKAIQTASSTTGASDYTAIGAMAFFIIPIIILWIGIAAAQQMSIIGAGAVVNRGKGIMKLGYKVPNALFKTTGIPGGIKKAKDHYVKKGAPGFLGKIPGLRGQEATERLEDRFSGLLTKGSEGWKNANEISRRKRIAARAKEYDENNTSESQMVLDLKSADEITRNAAAMTLAKKKLIKDETRLADVLSAVSDPDTQTDILEKTPQVIRSAAGLDTVYNSLKGDEAKQEELRGKVDYELKKDNRVKILIDHDIKAGTDPTKAYRNRLEGLSAENLAKQKDLHEDIKTNENLKSFMKEISEDENKKIFHQELFRRMSVKQQAAYINADLNPKYHTA